MSFAKITSRGFTLFEMIVVIVITGLMAAVLLQGLSMVLRTRLSVSSTIADLQTVVVGQNVPVDPLRGILPDYSNNPNQFKGQARTMSGQTLRPLLSPPGAPTPFKMSLDYDGGSNQTVLTYEEPGRAKTELARWPGSDQSFKYRDVSGDWQSSWPPQASTSQTPWLIWIDTGPTAAPLVAAVSGPHDRVTRLEDSPFASAISPK
jgi:prepilin-type N-terminal cleavage/methylation domain-containing protein